MQIINAISSKISGLLSGLSANSQILPTNKYINDYNLKDGSLFKIKLQAFKVPDIKISTGSNGINVHPTNDPNPVGEFEILYNQDELSIAHGHNYDVAGGFVGGIVNSISNKGLFGLDGRTIEFAKGVVDLFKNVESGQGGTTTLNTDWNTTGTLDIAKAYKGSSNPPSITVTFVALATENPLLEVVAPAVLFTYLSYPHISKEKSLREVAKMVADMSSSFVNSVISSIGFEKGTDGSPKITEAQKNAKSAVESASNLFNGISSDKWRYRLGDTPPYWKVSTSNGLFNLQNASLTNVNITYHGPWIEAPSSTSILSALQTFSSVSKMGFNPSSIFPSSSIIGSVGDSLSSLLSDKSNKRGGYPSYATISLTFQNNFNVVFGEEWLTSLTGDSSITSSIF
jgi:hypothetical protein